MEPELRVISRDDWATFKALRLRALADSPDAFAVPLAEAQASTDAEWRERAGGSARVVMAFVSDEARAVAMGGLHTPEDSDEAFIWGMWVDGAWRGRGVGSRILAELLEHAERVGRQVSLHVSEGNDARRVYESHGFVSTGEWEPLREGSEVRIEKLRRPHV